MGVAPSDLKTTGNQQRTAVVNAPPPPLQPVRIALVDDEESVHQLMRNVFKKHAPDWVLESYLDSRKALKHIPQTPPQAVLMDISMPGGTGIECAKSLKTLLPDLPVVMLSAHVDAETLLGSMMAGSCGCLYKPAAAPDIILALQRAMAGTLTLCERAEKTMLESFYILGKNFAGGQLTEREQEVMACLCQQKTDKEIGETLGIGTGTVHVHVNSIFKKLNVHSRADAIRKILNRDPSV